MNLDNRNVFVTGGTGTVGSQVVHELLERGAFVTIYSRDQNKQFKMAYDIASKRLTFRNGDICDKEILRRSMEHHDAVIHCAAAKHVPLCEQNADNAIKVNVEGTRNVLDAALRNGVKKSLMLSTDKAVEPSSVMGVTKFLAERLFLEYSTSMHCAIVRLGNVFASNGSVVPTFQDRIKHKLPLVVNNPNVTRYFLTQKEAGKFIVDRLEDDETESGAIYIKKMKLMTILALAHAMAPDPSYSIKKGDLSQGEKLSEKLFSTEESHFVEAKEEYFKISKKQRFADAVLNPQSTFTEEEITNLVRSIKP